MMMKGSSTSGLAFQLCLWIFLASFISGEHALGDALEELPAGSPAKLAAPFARPAFLANVQHPPQDSSLARSLQQDTSFFTPIEFTDKKALNVNQTFDYAEAYMTRPVGSNTGSGWVLRGFPEIQGEKFVWGQSVSWVTICGYLQWDKAIKRVKYVAEVDGCAEVIRFRATQKGNPSVTQYGKITIVVDVDNCVYSKCEHLGCGDSCTCANSNNGLCSCGAGKFGFVGMYIWETNTQACVYQGITPVVDPRTTAGLFYTTSSTSRVTIPFKFPGTVCLPSLADDNLQVTNAECRRVGPDPDTSKATRADVYRGNADSGGLASRCNDAEGIYRVVVDVPNSAGQYQCYLTFNDELGERTLAQLAVMQ